MIEEIPQKYLALTAGAFVLGWLVAKFGSWLASRSRQRHRDPRDDRIRSLEAEHRIAISSASKTKDDLDTIKTDLSETQTFLTERDTALQEHVTVIQQLRSDLKESVKKTRELRAELQDRATENVRSEVKLREVETELEVNRASADLIATGVLDYSVAPDGSDEDSTDDDLRTLMSVT